MFWLGLLFGVMLGGSLGVLLMACLLEDRLPGEGDDD